MADVALRALGWDHPRCMSPMRACAEHWRTLSGVAIRWEARSLEAFGDQPLEDVAGDYDLIVIDHPFCGRAERTGCLRPIDALLDAAALATLGTGAIGPSHDSYTYAGHQWGLATDGACQVAAVRDDLMAGEATPRSWDEALDLARGRPGAVALPLSPPHAISSWLSIVGAHGAEPFASEQTDRRATALLAGLARVGPETALGWEPPDALALMTTTDEIAYIPLTYGYSTYATLPPRPCRFTDVPTAGNGPSGAVLGGAGLAVSAASRQPAEAAAFAAWASGAEAQQDIVARTGGQPGHRSAWDDPALDALAGGFYSGTRATIEQAWVRPRDEWWPPFQLEAGRLLTDNLLDGDPDDLTARLRELHRRRSG
jgi:multiple sugar transport system substrate-binding protein